MRGLEGRRSLVVGGAGALGAAVAAALRAEGAKVVCADIRPQGSDIVVDVRSTKSIGECFNSATALLSGHVEVLVYTAGVLGESSVAATDDELWDRVIDTNLSGAMRVCRTATPTMVEGKWGRIVLLASQLAFKGAHSMSAYAASKAGVVAFSKSLALEVSEHNVLVNCVAPGPFETPMLASASTAWRERKLRELPLGRFGTVDEIVPSVVLLASDPGGNLYVGQTLHPNSGDVMV